MEDKDMNVALAEDTDTVLHQLVSEQDTEKMKDLTNLFNMQQTKKNALRINKLNNVMDKVSDEMMTRLEKRPGEFSNKDLIDYMNAAQNAIDKSAKSIGNVENIPTISPSFQQNNQININMEDKIDRTTRENVINFLDNLLNSNTNEFAGGMETDENQH